MTIKHIAVCDGCGLEKPAVSDQDGYGYYHPNDWREHELSGEEVCVCPTCSQIISEEGRLMKARIADRFNKRRAGRVDGAS